MQNFFQSISNTLNAIPDIIVGIILLVVAYLVALLAKKVLVALLKKLDFGKKLNKSKETNTQNNKKLTDVIGKIVFLVVFILFLPSILNKFGLNAVTAPVVDLINTFVQYIPNVVAAAIILFVGFFVANIIRQIIVAAIDATKVEKLQAKVTRGKSNFNVAKFLATLAYVVVAIVVVICAVNVLNIPAISDPATLLLGTLINSIPSIILAVVVFFAGIFIANLAYSFILALLDSLKLDEKCNKLLAGENKELKPIAFGKIICGIVRAVVIVLFLVEAINTLNFAILTNVGTVIIAYLPKVLVAVIFALIAYVVCRVVDAKFTSEKAKNISKIVKTVVITVIAFIVLSQLGIAPVIVNTAFVTVIVAMGVAFALAVGLGGRKFVEENLEGVKLCKKCKKDDEK